MLIRVNLDGKGERTPSGRSRQFKDIEVGFYHMRVQACACIFLHMIKPCSFFSSFLVVYGSQRTAEPHIQKQAFNHKHCSFGLVKAFFPSRIPGCFTLDPAYAAVYPVPRLDHLDIATHATSPLQAQALIPTPKAPMCLYSMYLRPNGVLITALFRAQV